MIQNSYKLYCNNKFDNLKGNKLIYKILRENTHQLHKYSVNEIISDGIIVKELFKLYPNLMSFLLI